MNEGMYEIRGQLSRDEALALRAEWQRFYPEVVDYFERVKDEDARKEAKEYERRRKLKGGLLAIAISAFGVGVFIGLCFVWGRKG